MSQLSVLANEIHEQAIADFKVSERFAYGFIMKVKRIRDERLYKELGHGSFETYCETAWNVKRGYMDDRILLADSFGQNFDRTYGQLGHSKSLLLARMEPEIRQKIESSNDVNELTVTQLKLAERQAKEAEERAVKAEQDARHWQSVARSAQNQPPRVETKMVEVVPEQVKKELDDKEFQIKNLRAGYQEAKEKLKEYELRKTDDYDEELSRKQREKLQHEAEISTINLRIAYKNFIEKAAITGYIQGAIAYSNQLEKDRLAEMVDSAQQIIDQTKLALRGRKLGVVNE